MVMEAVNSQKLYCERTLWHSNSMFGSSHSVTSWILEQDRRSWFLVFHKFNPGKVRVQFRKYAILLCSLWVQKSFQSFWLFTEWFGSRALYFLNYVCSIFVSPALLCQFYKIYSKIFYDWFLATVSAYLTPPKLPKNICVCSKFLPYLLSLDIY